MKIYTSNDIGGEGRKKKQNKLNWQKQGKSPFGFLTILLSMIWTTDCFSVSKRTENKPGFP